MDSSNSDTEDGHSSDESFSTIQESLEQISDLVELFTKQIDVAEKQMLELQPAVEDTHLSQLQGPPFLETSPFRHQMFLVKAPGFPGIDLQKRYAFKTICETMRNYLFDEKLVTDDGMVTLTRPLKALLGIKKPTVSYVELMGALRAVIV